MDDLRSSQVNRQEQPSREAADSSKLTASTTTTPKTFGCPCHRRRHGRVGTIFGGKCQVARGALCGGLSRGRCIRCVLGHEEGNNLLLEDYLFLRDPIHKGPPPPGRNFDEEAQSMEKRRIVDAETNLQLDLSFFALLCAFFALERLPLERLPFLPFLSNKSARYAIFGTNFCRALTTK
jgi:hypothetical protein